MAIWQSGILTILQVLGNLAKLTIGQNYSIWISYYWVALKNWIFQFGKLAIWQSFRYWATWWILIFPTSRLTPQWPICRWGILISRYINIARHGYNNIINAFIMHSEWPKLNLWFRFSKQTSRTTKGAQNRIQHGLIIQTKKYIPK